MQPTADGRQRDRPVSADHSELRPASISSRDVEIWASRAPDPSRFSDPLGESGTGRAESCLAGQKKLTSFEIKKTFACSKLSLEA